jgi:hypothetical protein
MAQVPALFAHRGDSIDYIASGDKAMGDVVEIGSKIGVVTAPIDYSENPLGAAAVEGVFDFPQKAETIAAGTLVYWDDVGDPVDGDAGTGAATASAGGNTLIGPAVSAQPNGTNTTAATDMRVRVKLGSMGLNVATLAGSMTADDIVGSDGALTITGEAETGADDTGGTVAIVGGAGASSKAGGAVSATGGAGGANANGGAASLVGGVGTGTGSGGAVAVTGGNAGATTAGTGGAVAIAGGTAGAGANYTGGAVSATGGAGKGSGAGGAASLVAGAGGTTGAGGAIAITAGAGGSTSGANGTVTIAGGVSASTGNVAGGAVALAGGAGKGSSAGGAASVAGGAGGATGAGGAVAITGGAATAGDASGGAVNITGGALNGSGANGAVNIGADKATVVTIGYASGKLYLVGLPTSDPTSLNQVWANSNVLTLSAGE